MEKGKLKIILGYAAGTGKTYTMLEEAHQLKSKGIDVVLGYIEPHDRQDTINLTEGIETIPAKMVDYKGLNMREFNIDEALARKPQVILVDELAHTNAPGSRHSKRYQDIEELLRAGINVYTTCNIQHLESLNDIVSSIAKIDVKERVPDIILNEAAQIEVVDIEPDELIERIKEGKVYKQNQVNRALDHFFRKEKLVALREIALRKAADRVNKVAEEERYQSGLRDYHTGEHVLVCISPSPTCSKTIRAASRLAEAFHCKFTGICIETPQIKESGELISKSLNNNIELAKSLGARIVSVYGDNIGYQISEYAKVGNVSKIVLGKTLDSQFSKKNKVNLLEQINQLAPNVDIYIIPDLEAQKYHKQYDAIRKNILKKIVLNKDSKIIATDFTVITFIICLVTALGVFFKNIGISENNIAMTYILGVVIATYRNSSMVASIYSSFLSVVTFNFFFTIPYFSLKADTNHIITFVTMFIVSLLVSSLINKMNLENKENAKRAYRTEILLENSKMLRRCKSKKEVWNQVSNRVIKLLDLSVIVYIRNDKESQKGFSNILFYPREGMQLDELYKYASNDEKAVAQWVLSNGKRAGISTETLPNANAMYLPVQADDKVEGVFAIILEERRPLSNFEYDIATAMLNEAAVKLKGAF